MRSNRPRAIVTARKPHARALHARTISAARAECANMRFAAAGGRWELLGCCLDAARALLKCCLGGA
eukprot:3465165-Lingulodinium_polyedra.AAC.1